MDSRAARRFVTSPHLLPRQPVVDPVTARVDVSLFRVLYAVGFGGPVLLAVDSFVDFLGYPSGALWAMYVGILDVIPLVSLSRATKLLTYEAAPALAALVMLVWLTRHRGLPTAQVGVSLPDSRRWRHSHSGGLLLAAAVYWSIMTIDSIVMSFLTLSGLGERAESYDLNAVEAFVLGPVMGLGAGLAEEILLVGALVVVAERAGWSTVRLYSVAVVLRLAIHLYYGFAALAVLPWAVVSLWLFRRTRSVVPLIVCHTLWNTSVFWPPALGTPLHWAVPVVGTILLARAWGRRPVVVRPEV